MEQVNGQWRYTDAEWAAILKELPKTRATQNFEQWRSSLENMKAKCEAGDLANHAKRAYIGTREDIARYKKIVKRVDEVQLLILELLKKPLPRIARGWEHTVPKISAPEIASGLSLAKQTAEKNADYITRNLQLKTRESVVDQVAYAAYWALTRIGGEVSLSTNPITHQPTGPTFRYFMAVCLPILGSRKFTPNVCRAQIRYFIKIRNLLAGNPKTYVEAVSLVESLLRGKRKPKK